MHHGFEFESLRMKAKSQIWMFFAAPIILAISVSDIAYAAYTKVAIILSGKVTIETPSCGNQPQFRSVCASQSHAASDKKLKFS